MATDLFAAAIVLLVLIGPLLIKPIERNLELFFLTTGLFTALVMREFDWGLVAAVLTEPLSFTLAVLVFGAAFRGSRAQLDRLLARLIVVVEPRRICFYLTVALAGLAPLITPVVSALVFVEAIALLRLERSTRNTATVLACFAIGIGAGITPLGMPGIAVVLSSLKADFWYLGRLLGPLVAVVVLVAAAPIFALPFNSVTRQEGSEPSEPWRLVVLIRPAKLYVFIAGLVALSDGLRPVADQYVHRLPAAFLFWINSMSAVVNNSTLAALEIGPTLSMGQQRAALLGLLISGGMLVTGNIPNLVAAGRLGITSREWARVGLVAGVLLMLLCFAALHLIG